MTATDYAALLQRVHAEAAEWSIDVDMKNPERTRKIMDAVKERIHKREAEEAVKNRRRNKEAAALAQAAAADANASVAAAEEQGAGMAAALVNAEQQMKDAFDKDPSALGPEPDAFETALLPPLELPALALDQVAGMEELCARIRALAGNSAEAASLTASDAAAIAICQGLLPSCPDEASAQALFGAVCFAADGALAAAAYRTLMRWAGVPELAQANDTLLVDALELEEGPTTTATTTWLPGAADFISALQHLGCSKAYTAKITGAGTSGRTRGGAAGAVGANTSRAATPGPHADAADAAPLPATNLQLVLRLLAMLLQLGQSSASSAPSAMQRPRVSLPEGHGRSLLLALLHLHMDNAVRAVALPQLQAAIAALVDAFGDTEWGRVGPEVALRLGEPFGPSHRAAVRLLRELPGRGGRVRGLRQTGALALLRTLVSGSAKSAASTSRGGGRSRCSSGGASPAEVRELLSGKGKMLELAHGSKGSKADYWVLLSVLDAADMVLWSHVDAPGGNTLDEDFVEWFQQWMQRLSKELRSVHLAHFVRTRLSELENHYAYCTQLGCVGGGQGDGGDMEEM